MSKRNLQIERESRERESGAGRGGDAAIENRLGRVSSQTKQNPS